MMSLEELDQIQAFYPTWESLQETEIAREYLTQFFTLLDTQEESDSGHTFNPTYISCCRVLSIEKLKEILTFLRKWCRLPDKTLMKQNISLDTFFTLLKGLVLEWKRIGEQSNNNTSTIIGPLHIESIHSAMDVLIRHYTIVLDKNEDTEKDKGEIDGISS